MNESKEELHISRFDYSLPEAQIAQNPLTTRGASRLLLYKDDQIEHLNFSEIVTVLPENTLVVFNETKVIPARIIFTKDSGARIEIFLIEPIEPSGGMELNLSANKSVTWKAMVGNAKKWKSGQILKGHTGETFFRASWNNRDKMWVTLHWDSGIPFSQLLEEIGKVPLPPYIHRDADEMDENSYQTVYAARKGAVAAPTAGLHFTPAILDELNNSGHSLARLTLHVGAGTFQPVIHENVWEHPMHSEYFEVSLHTLEKLKAAQKIAAVGTTSLRTLESLYWLSALLQTTGKWHSMLEKDIPYTVTAEFTFSQAISNLIDYCNKNQLDALSAFTAIMIVPGYTIRSAEMLITNFHMPKSTLIMLVEAFIGPAWREVYEEALKNNYRFLSYGDSSILFRALS